MNSQLPSQKLECWLKQGSCVTCYVAGRRFFSYIASDFVFFQYSWCNMMAQMEMLFSLLFNAGAEGIHIFM